MFMLALLGLPQRWKGVVHQACTAFLLSWQNWARKTLQWGQVLKQF